MEKLQALGLVLRPGEHAKHAHLPDHWPRKYGTVKFQPPESCLGQLAYPFKGKIETPYG